MKLPSLPEGEITAIEVHRANPYVELGISVVGGNETPLINIVIQEVYRDGVIARDGRLLAGDQILQVRALVFFREDTKMNNIFTQERRKKNILLNILTISDCFLVTIHVNVLASRISILHIVILY